MSKYLSNLKVDQYYSFFTSDIDVATYNIAMNEFI